MENFGPTLFSTIILYQEVDIKLVREPVTLEIDESTYLIWMAAKYINIKREVV